MSASPFTSDDLAFLGSLLANAAREEIMPRFRTLHAVDRRRKTSSFDIVTDADEACEAAVLTALRARHPEAVPVSYTHLTLPTILLV